MTTRRPNRTRVAATAAVGPLPLIPMPVDAPDSVRAVSLGLALLKSARVETWDDLVASLGADDQAAARLDGIDLTRADLELLDAHLGLLGMIRVVPGTRGSGYTVTVAICDRCGRWMLSTGAVPHRCRLTIGCAGSMVKAIPAKHPKPAASAAVPLGQGN